MAMNQVFKNVRQISCQKAQEGYTLQVDSHQVPLVLSMVSNFEVRMVTPVEISNIYFGSERGEYEDVAFNISFKTPCKIEISNPDARCYLSFEQMPLDNAC